MMKSDSISAVVLAAGHSSRMGKPKMILPWERTTVIGRVIEVLLQAQLQSIFVIAGENHEDIEKVLKNQPIEIIYNNDHAFGEMLSSVKEGLKHLPTHTTGALIVLGDQPQIEVDVVDKIIDMYISHSSKIIIPSYHKHRGHPWLVDRYYWEEIAQLEPESSLRDFLRDKQNQITYVNVETKSILDDIDTPQDYLTHCPEVDSD